MWSGPRNLSTAMMYSFGNRSDCAIWDEPFYAPYLANTSDPHPMQDEILTAHETDPAKVAAACLGPIPDGKPHFYMKHMPHHMLPDFPLDWAKDCVNVHLIRHPSRVIASYANKREIMSLDDIGYPQQAAVFEKLGGVVLDSGDVRANPRAAMQALCAAIGLPWDDAMLSWPAGPRAADGVWAKHWYNAVHQSTGFAGQEGPRPTLKDEAATLCAAALPYYDVLAKAKLKIAL